MEKTKICLQSERLILRRPVMDDADALVHNIKSHPDISRNMLSIPSPYTLDDASAFLEKVTEAVWDEENKNRIFAVTRASDGVLMGMCGIHSRGWGCAEISYWIGADFWGNGYASEAVQRVMQYGFEELGYYRIQATYFSWNKASRRVQEKVGMQYEGLLRGFVVKNDEPIDLGMCAILRPEWEAAQG